MRAIARTLVLLLLPLGMGCEGPTAPLVGPPPVQPDTATTSTPPPPPAATTCAADIAAVSGPGTLPVLGLGCVAERYTSELWVHGDWAYTGTYGWRTATGNVVKVWNVAGDAPILRDSVVVPQATTVGDVQVSDDGAVLAVATEHRPHGALVLYDLADPAKPRLLVRHHSPRTAPGVHTAELARVDGRLYAFLSVDPDEDGISRLVVLDLVEPAAPREVHVQAMGDPYVHDVFVRDGLLFTALWNAGGAIWDVGGGGKGGSPEAPALVSTFATWRGRVHNLWWYHDPDSGSRRYLFVGEEGPSQLGHSSLGDVHVVDMSNMAAPREVAFYTQGGAGAHNFSVDESSGVLYVAYKNGGVRALDVRGDLGNCPAEQRDPHGRCDLAAMGREVGRGLVGTAPVHVWGVHRVGAHLYASDALNGLWKLDVSSLVR